LHFFLVAHCLIFSHNQPFRLGRGGCTWPGGGCTRGGRGDARASCASPLGTPLPPHFDFFGVFFFLLFARKISEAAMWGAGVRDIAVYFIASVSRDYSYVHVYLEYQSVCPIVGMNWFPPPNHPEVSLSPTPTIGSKRGGSNTLLQLRGWGDPIQMTG